MLDPSFLVVAADGRGLLPLSLRPLALGGVRPAGWLRAQLQFQADAPRHPDGSGSDAGISGLRTRAVTRDPSVA